MMLSKIKQRTKSTISIINTFSPVIGLVFANLSPNKKIKFNPKPFPKKKKSEKKHQSLKEDPIDLHSKIIKKIDDLDKGRRGASLMNQKIKMKSIKNVKDKKATRNNRLVSKDKKLNLKMKRVGKEREKPKKTEKAVVSSADIQRIKEDERGKKLIDEKTGFGWKGLGSRRIVFDKNLKEYCYEVIEPHLNEKEEDIKNKLIYLFRVRVDIDVFDMDIGRRMQHLEKALDKLVVDNHINLEGNSKDNVFYYIFREFAGYDKIDILMHDEVIEDISCDGCGVPIFIFHKKYESIRSNIVFNNTDELDSFVVKLSQMSGKQISVYEPIVDGKLSDGSRLQTTFARTITKHSTFTVRKFRESPLTPIDLIANNTMSLDMAAYFWLTIENGASILFCGGTATGKTTMLNAISLFLPSTYKIVSIEDTREINLPHENWIAGTTRKGFSTSEASKTGKDIDMFDLIKVALRQRPKVIIVGEVRGREAYTLFQAMTTGHLSYSTIHASDMHSLIQRLESPPISLPRALLTSLDLIVFLNSLTVEEVPVRRVTNVTEVIKLDPETNRLVTITPFNWVSEIDDRFENNGGSRLLYKTKLQHGWGDKRLNQELRNRMTVLDWMRRKNLRTYKEVGRIVSDYSKNPEEVLEKAREDTR